MECLTQGVKSKEEEDDHTSGEEDTDSGNYSNTTSNSECIFISDIVDTKAVLKALNPRLDNAMGTAVVGKLDDEPRDHSPFKHSPSPYVPSSSSSSKPPCPLKNGDRHRGSTGSIAVGSAYTSYHDHRDLVTSRGFYVPYGSSKHDEIPPEGTGRGVANHGASEQWPGAAMDIDEGEQSDEGGASTPPNLMLDLATLHVRQSSRPDEKTMLHMSTGPSNEVYLFNQSPECFSPGRDTENVAISVGASPLKGIWVNSECDFDKVVRNLHLALAADDEPYSLDRRIPVPVQPVRAIQRVREAEALRRSLQQSLGTDAFDEARMFLRAVASIQGEDLNSQDDEDLLQQLEGIVGADGLQYMEDIFSLITLEDDIEEVQTQTRTENNDTNMREAIK